MNSASAGSNLSASFVDAILFHAVKAPQAPAIGLESGVLTYGQLAAAIFSATDRCRKAGLQRGALAGLVISDPVWHICLIAALFRLGVPSVSIGAGEVKLFPSGLGAVLHDGRLASTPVANAVLVAPDWFTTPSEQTHVSGNVFAPAELCRIALSSGTTGVPKPIALNSQIVWDRLTTYSLRGRFAASDRIFCGPHLDSQFGFAITFAALAYGKMVCFADNAASAIPVMSTYKADLAIVSVFQLTGIVDADTRSAGGLTSVREIQAGGSLIPPSLLARTRARLAATIVSAYASTEAGTIAFAPIDQLGDAHADGAVGFVTPWAAVEVCDENEETLPIGRDGVIRVNALGMAPLYEPGMKTVTSPGAFYPGDTGRLLRNGMLVVAGRTVEVVNIGGNKIAPSRIENVVLGCTGVKDAAVFTVDVNLVLPQVWVAVVGDGTVNMAEIVRRCAETIMVGAPSVVKLVKEIPRNSAGKILRDQLRSQLAPGATL